MKKKDRNKKEQTVRNSKKQYETVINNNKY